MLRFLCLLFVLGTCPIATADENTPSSVDDKVLKLQQAVFDLEARTSEQLGHQEAAIQRLLQENAQLKEDVIKLEVQAHTLKKDLGQERELRKVRYRYQELSYINRQLAATRTVSGGPLGLRQQRVYAVTGTQRNALIARKKELEKEGKEAMARIMQAALIPFLPIAP